MSTDSTAPQQRKRGRVNPPTSELTSDDMFDTLTGFEEKFIRDQFGMPLQSLAQSDSFQLMRALVFVDKLRAGLKTRAAHEAAQGLTLGQVDDYFADDPDEVDPEDPVTDQGKGDTPPESEPTS